MTMEKYGAARAIIEKQVVHIEDLASPDLYGADAEHRLATVQLEGIRTALFVPLVWEQHAIGAIGGWRREVRPFSQDEIALVELPIAGLMSDRPAAEMAEKADKMVQAMAECGCTLNNAYMQHSLLALVVIPELRISDLGLVDVTKFELTDLFEGAK